MRLPCILARASVSTRARNAAPSVTMSEPVIEQSYGFAWGPVVVRRLAHFTRGRRESYVVSVNGLDIYVSRTGRSVRVFRDGRELA